jgi:hypothetical protein
VKIENQQSTLAVRPPEYFPGLPFMALFQEVDRFVLADPFEYSRRSRRNRARLRTPQGAQWITVPVKGGQTHRPIAEVEIDNRSADESTGGAHWRSRHWRALQYDYRSAPYFEPFEPRLAPFFETEWQKLGPCACASVRLLAQGAGLETTITRATALPGAPATLPAILRALEDEPEALLAPPDAAAHDAALLDEADGIDCEVRVARFDAPRYHQHFDGFVAGLSFADLLFEYGPEARALLREGLNVEG